MSLIGMTTAAVGAAVSWGSNKIADIAAGAGGQNMSFDGVTEGIDRDAMKTYLENMKIELLDTVKEQINSVSDVLDAINAGWQGESRDVFLRQFASQRRAIIEDLEDEYKDLMARFKELQEFYYKQDEQMMELLK